MKPFTIVWLTARRIVRADFKPGRDVPQLVELHEQSRPAADDIGTLTDAALRLSKRRTQRVWVLTSDAATTVLNVSRDLLQGVPAADFDQSLSFEAETLTGISSFESVLGYVPLRSTAEDRRFWVIQVMTAARERIQRAARDYGTRLLGISHPAGLQTALAEPGGTNWKRVEIWDDVTATVTHDASGTGIEITAGVSIRQRRAIDVAGDDRVTERLLDDPTAASDGSGSGTFNLNHEDHLRHWLTAWAQQVTAPQPVCPVVAPMPTPMSGATRSTISLSLAALAVLGAVGVTYFTQKRLTQLSAGIERLQQPAKRVQELQAETEKLTKEKAELIARRDVIRAGELATRVTVDRQRQRVLRLFELLSKHHHEEIVVREIQGSGNETRVTGLCLQTAHVQRLAQAVGEGLTEIGYVVLPIEVAATSQRDDGGPWQFTLRIQEPAESKSVGGQQRPESGNSLAAH